MTDTISEITTTSPAKTPGVQIAADDVQRVRAIYDQGLCVQALEAAQAIAPLKLWRGTQARLLAARIAFNAGALRLGMAHDWLAYRESSAEAEAIENEARRLSSVVGPWRASEFIRAKGDLPDAPPLVQSWWLATQAILAAAFRDFDAAEQLIDRAVKLSPDDPWTRVEHATVLEHHDRYDDALAATEHAMSLRAWYRPAVQKRAHLLCLINQDGKAHDLLEEASSRLENMWVVHQLAMLQTELGAYTQARANLDRLETLAPLMEKGTRKWLAACRSDAAYYAGDIPAAITLALVADTPFHKKVVEQLQRPDGGGTRVLLDVSFVRQHHMTCAPATLAAVSRYWSMPAEHLEIVEEICYDGTPAYSERNWAQTHGFVAREFTVTFDSAKALIDRGIPFTLTTVQPTSAHLQAVIGYDSRRGTLLIRDPYQRHFGEFVIDGLLEYQRSTGPRGMLLVPTEKAHLLDGVPLPDATLYDHFHQLMSALQKHERSVADAQRAEMAQLDPNHRLTIWADRALAAYDANVVGVLDAIDRLLSLYPGDDFLQLARLGNLRALSRRPDILSTLADLCANPKSDPVFRQQYAQELLADAREHASARRLLRRALRQRPLEAGTLYVLGRLYWQQRDFETALRLFRITSCLADKDEQYAQAFFEAMRSLKRSDEALLLLRNRLARYGAKSSQPAITLFTALGYLGRFDEGFAVLDEALARRPDDGVLLLFAADMHARHGMADRARQLLESARGKARESACLRSAANVAMYCGDTPESLRLWLQVLEHEPLAMDALRNAVQATAETSSRAHATELVQRTAERFPHHYDVHRALVEWLDFTDVELQTLESAVAHLIHIHPSDAWAHRQMAAVKSRLGQHDAALAEAQLGVRLDPGSAEALASLAAVQAAQSKIEEAAETCRAAIRLSADCERAIRLLMELSDEECDRQAALAFIKSELEKQVTFGEGLLVYRFYAASVLDHAQTLASLREALDARPDLWQCWSAMSRQLVTAGQLDDALDYACHATERFPLVAQLWLDLANVHRLRQDREAQRQALERAVEINPGWSMPRRLLVFCLQTIDQPADAVRVARQTARIFALESPCHLVLAMALWTNQERDAAINAVEEAISLDPDNEDAWNSLRSWAGTLQRPALAADMARRLCQRRPGEARSWLLVARMLSQPENYDERIAALERAIALAPRDADAYDLRAFLLAESGHFDEALAACRPAPWGDSPPMRLRGRAAWIEARRGKIGLAIQLINEVLQENPKYHWAQCQLAGWYDQLRDYARYVAIARRVAQLAPYDAESHSMLGDAYEKNKQLPKARAAYAQALRLDPTHRWAGMSLFDLQLFDNDFDSAAETLAILQKHAHDAWVAAREVQLAARSKGFPAARALLEKFCKVADADERSIMFASRAVLKAGARDKVEASLFQGAFADDSNPAAGAVWASLVCERRDWASLEKWFEFWCGGASSPGAAVEAAAAEAAAVYMKTMAQAANKFRLNRFLARHWDWLHAHHATWAQGSFCLAATGQYARCVAWTDDWAERTNVPQWVLTNRVLCQLYIGDEAESLNTARSAIALADCERHQLPKLWLALDEALNGKPHDAGNRIRMLNMNDTAMLDRFLYTLVEVARDASLCLDEKPSPGKSKRRALDWRRRLLSACRACPRFSCQRPYRRAYLRVVRRMVAARPTVGMRLWGTLQSVMVACGRAIIPR